MRLQLTHPRRTSAAVAVAAAAALSLTACGGAETDDSAPAGASAEASTEAGTSASPSASDSTEGPGTQAGGAPTAEGSGGGGDTPASASATGSPMGAGGPCRTSQLAFSSSGGMAEGEVLINLRNTGASSCSMHGFPGLDLKGKDGTVSAERGDRPVPVVTLAPGEGTNFPLHFPPNDSGGSGVTFTSAVVTPPNETHSHRMSLSVNIPAGSGSAPRITVEPVGSGK
ncbi:DUF4232 domain-containing protein [Streptomyces sp. NPDC049970]|uniref:DUF4232 domain-containing protein n=1 Tax=Streptomyces sp. NPDC049970 TaxID=3155033 RepID=UPI003430E831